VSRRKKRRKKAPASLSHRGSSQVQRADGRTTGSDVVKQESFVVHEHSGPLPAPWTLAEYKELGENIPELIVAMAVDQQTHDHSMEKTEQAHDHAIETRGQIFAFIVALAGLGLGGYLLANDKSLWGAAAAFGPFVGLVSLFAWGRWQDLRQRAKGGSLSKPPQA
jgi:uncharacterized membrane protein